MAAIRMEGGEILELTAQEREAFVRAVSPIYGEARSEYGRDLVWWACERQGTLQRGALQSGFVLLYTGEFLC